MFIIQSIMLLFMAPLLMNRFSKRIREEDGSVISCITSNPIRRLVFEDRRFHCNKI